jgi:hypothetical protein
VAGIVYHKSHRISWNQSRHSYLVDLGSGIEIQQIEVSDLYENTLLDPPYPETRFFEIEIDEKRQNGQKIFVFQNISPVRAKRKPDWHILKFRIRHGSWTILERFRSRNGNGEIQWIYTNDFALLFVSSGGRHDLDMLLTLMTDKLDAIAGSIAAGSRIPSQFESQQACRHAFDEIFTDGIDGAFQETILYQDHATGFPAGTNSGSEMPSRAGIGIYHGKMSVNPRQAAELNVELDQIEDLQDLGWLND